jgi:hypothetical protein
MTHDKDKHDFALVEEENAIKLSRLICKNKNQCLMGNPFVEMKTILNSLSMFQKMPGNLALHTSISYLLTASKCTM